ncbi:MAG: hypothetical protein EOO38_22850, partial [Cytophagaceae bacterium]
FQGTQLAEEFHGGRHEFLLGGGEEICFRKVALEFLHPGFEELLGAQRLVETALEIGILGGRNTTGFLAELKKFFIAGLRVGKCVGKILTEHVAVGAVHKRAVQLGGTAISEPAGLLSGLIRNPLVLVYHFFSVAFYAVWCRLQEEPVWKAPYVVGVESLLIVWTAASVIGPYLMWEVRR